MQRESFISKMSNHLGKLFPLTVTPSQALLHVIIAFYQQLDLAGIGFQIYVFLLLELLTHLLGLHHPFLQFLDETRDGMNHGLECLVSFGDGMGEQILHLDIALLGEGFQ